MAEIDELRNKFQKGNATENRQAIIDLFKFVGIDDKTANKFVVDNYQFLAPELNSYGFVIDNCFVEFFLKIYKERKEVLDLIMDPENWSIIHNSIAQKILKPNQIKFRSEELDQPKLLLNPSFYNNINNMDKLWVLQLWEWCNTEEPNNQIVHQGVRFLINSAYSGVKLNIEKADEENIQVQNLKKIIEGQANRNLYDKESIITLRRLLIYNKDIVSIANEFKNLFTQDNKFSDEAFNIFSNNIEKIRQKINNIDFISSPLVKSTDMSASVRACSENVQLSNRDAITGQYQEKEENTAQYKNKNNKNNFNNSSNREQNITSGSEAQSILKNKNIDLSNVRIKSASDIENIVNAVEYDLINNPIHRR